jgi:tRNA A37 methylthiotransferase MiaB
MKFVVDYFGCRSNQAEVQEWIIELEKDGYELTASPAEADFGILNTCSVTAKAEKDVLRFIGKTYRNTNTQWFIVGCTVTQDKAHLSGKYKNYFFFDNLEKKHLVKTVRERFPVTSRMIYHSSFKSRIFLKVQDGCNFRCSFCLVPFLRGKAQSLLKKEIADKAGHYAALGYQEVVLTVPPRNAPGPDRGDRAAERRGGDPPEFPGPALHQVSFRQGTAGFCQDRRQLPFFPAERQRCGHPAHEPRRQTRRLPEDTGPFP